jgi:hypothetical protein
MRRIFVFFRNWFLIDPLHYLSSRSDFGLEFAEIFEAKIEMARNVVQGTCAVPVYEKTPENPPHCRQCRVRLSLLICGIVGL